MFSTTLFPYDVGKTIEARRSPRGVAGPGTAGASPGERLELRTPGGGTTGRNLLGKHGKTLGKPEENGG